MKTNLPKNSQAIGWFDSDKTISWIGYKSENWGNPLTSVVADPAAPVGERGAER